MGTFYEPMSTWELEELTYWMENLTLSNGGKFRPEEIEFIKNVQGINGHILANYNAENLQMIGFKISRSLIVC